MLLIYLYYIYYTLIVNAKPLFKGGGMGDVPSPTQCEAFIQWRGVRGLRP